MNANTNPQGELDCQDYELELAQEEYERELALAEEEIRAELKVNLDEDSKADPTLVALDIQLETIKEELLRDKAKLAYAEKVKTGKLEEKKSKSGLGRLKAMIRSKLAPVMLGLSVSSVAVPAVATYSWLDSSVNESKLDYVAKHEAKQRSMALDGAASTLDSESKALLSHYSDKNIPLVKYLENKRGLARPSGRMIFSHILDNEIDHENFPKYGFDIRELEKPLSYDQMQRALDVYEKLSDDVREFRTLIKSLVLDPYLAECVTHESTDAEEQYFVERMKDTINRIMQEEKAADDKIIYVADKK